MLPGSLLAHTWGNQSAWCTSTIQRLATRNAESGDTLENPYTWGQQRNPPSSHTATAATLPGSKILHPSPLPRPESPPGSSEPQEYRPFSKGRLEWEPLRREPLYSSNWTSNCPRLHSGIAIGFKMPTLPCLVRGSVCREGWRWCGDVFGCHRKWQLRSDWLQSNSENQSREESPRFGGVCRGQSQTRTRAQRAWQASSAQQLRKLPV